MKKVFIDSDIFVRDLRYPRDSRSEINRSFLAWVRSKKIRGVTSIFNILEVCGILSFNLNEQELIGLYATFTNHYNVQVLFPADKEGNLQYDLIKIFDQILKKQHLGDAQISYIINRFANQLAAFVSWNSIHFNQKIFIEAKTPEAYLKGK